MIPSLNEFYLTITRSYLPYLEYELFDYLHEFYRNLVI